MARLRLTDDRRTLARIQRLCCLGLGGQVLVPMLLREVQALVPSFSVVFFWADPQQKLENVYTEMPVAETLPLYLSEFHNRRERDYVLTFTEAMRATFPTAVGDFHQRTLKVDVRDYLASEYYALCERMIGGGPRLLMKVSEGGRALGALTVNWQEGDRGYTARDVQVLECIAGFVAHGLSSAPDAQAFTAGDDSGMLVVDNEGTVLHASAAARRLLMMALHPRWAPETSWRMLEDPVPALVHLVRLLQAATGGALAPEPPGWRVRNAWGEFNFRACWLRSGCDSKATGVIGIAIERREPWSMLIFRNVEALPLSGREKRLCMLWAHEASTAEIAATMGVSAHTVITHKRNVYAKLGLHSRAAFVEALFTTGGAAALLSRL